MNETTAALQYNYVIQTTKAHRVALPMTLSYIIGPHSTSTGRATGTILPTTFPSSSQNLNTLTMNLLTEQAFICLQQSIQLYYCTVVSYHVGTRWTKMYPLLLTQSGGIRRFPIPGRFSCSHRCPWPWQRWYCFFVFLSETLFQPLERQCIKHEIFLMRWPV